MVSNGTLIDEKMANLIHMYDIKVTISIDGPEEIHDLNRVDAAGKGSFSRVIRSPWNRDAKPSWFSSRVAGGNLYHEA